jgi:hypothetical protein
VRTGKTELGLGLGTGMKGVAEYEYECLAPGPARGQTVDKQEMQEEDAQKIYIRMD